MLQVIRLLQAFSNVIFGTVLQQADRVSTEIARQFLCGSQASCFTK